MAPNRRKHNFDNLLSMKDLPGDYFRLKINSNDTFSRDKHPNNNCYNFTIEFPSASAEAIQNCTSQCNRYQITHVLLPIRTHIGTAMTVKPPPYISPVLRMKPLTNADATTTGIFKTKFGVASQVGYENIHEELCDLHILITCATFNEQLDPLINERNYMKNYPQHNKHKQQYYMMVKFTKRLSIFADTCLTHPHQQMIMCY